MMEDCVCTCARAERVGTPDVAPDTSAIILGAGAGLRFGEPDGKQFAELAGMPLLAWSILAFDCAPSIADICVVTPVGREREVEDRVLSGLCLRHEVTLVAGGAERQDSVLRGLMGTPEEHSLVAIHDGARPLIEADAIERCLAVLREDATLDGALLARPATDTLKVVDRCDRVVSTLDRTRVWCAQTPQCFRRAQILEAHERALFEGYQATDDASLIEWQGGRVAVVEGPGDNIKVTVREDLVICEALIASRIGVV